MDSASQPIGGKKFEKVVDDFRVLNMDFRLNELNQAIEVNFHGKWRIVDKIIKSVIRTEMRELGYGVTGKKKPGKDAVEDAWKALAYQQRYNPIKDYFSKLRERPYAPKIIDDVYQPYRIKDFSKRYFTNPDGMLGQWQHRWMVGCIAKAFQQERNPILVMGGDQEQGKSTYVRWFCPIPDYFREGEIKPDSKDERLRLADTFIQEVPELGSSTRRSDVDAFKNHITRKNIIERPPYAEGPVKLNAVCSFYATVNPDGAGFLIDSTGSSRFLICEVNWIDFAYYTEANAHNLWREALWFYEHAHRAWELLPSERAMRDKINAQYQMVSALDEIIDHYLEITKNDDDWMATIEIRDYLAPHYRFTNENGFYRELSRMLKARGLRRGRETYEEGKPHRKGWFGLKKRSIELE